MERGQSYLDPLTFSEDEEENWSSEEDKLLIQAWAKTCMDPVTTWDERSSSCWRRISDYYHAHKKSSWPERNPNALMCRFDTISSETTKFCGCVQQIIYLNQSGRTMKEMEEDAHLFYSARDPDKKPFVLMHCYQELKKYPKWQLFPASRIPGSRKKHKTLDASLGRTSNNNDFGAWTADLATEQRPLGVKKAKELLRRGKASAYDGNGYKLSLETLRAQQVKKDETEEAMKNARHARAYELQERQIALQEREAARKQLELDEKIMSMDTSGMSVVQKQFYKEKQEEIIARLHNKSG